VAIESEEYLTVARTDIAAGWSERQPNQHFKLQTLSVGELVILEGSFRHTERGTVPKHNFVFVAKIKNEFTLGLEILHAYDRPVDLGSQVLRLAEEEGSL
jgi:hypothetical protein